MSDAPKISIVMPSFNQGQYLEAAMRSVLDQNYPTLEYIVMDGGSTDNSVDIIRKYADRLTYWQSQKDRGQFAAITDGFRRASGEIYAFLNSDDMYLPWAFKTVARIFRDLPQVQWLTSRTMVIWDPSGQPIFTHWSSRHARTWFYRGWTLGHHGPYSGWIMQEATFWRRSLWEAAGARMDESLYTGGDFELWARFWEHANLVTTQVPLAGFRQHVGSKAAGPGGQDEYLLACRQILKRYQSRTVQNPFVVRLLSLLYKYTGRGGGRFGSTLNWVDYDLRNEFWLYRQRVVI